MTKKNWLVILGLTLAFGIAMSGCDNGAGDTGVEDGNLAGSSWERTAKSSDFDFTYTYTFTSADAGKYTQTGWGMVGSKKQTYNVTTNFTYIYDGAVNKLGVITLSSGSKQTFSISSNYKTLTVSGSSQYTRK
jgi:hypothetical protein